MCIAGSSRSASASRRQAIKNHAIAWITVWLGEEDCRRGRFPVRRHLHSVALAARRSLLFGLVTRDIIHSLCSVCQPLIKSFSILFCNRFGALLCRWLFDPATRFSISELCTLCQGFWKIILFIFRQPHRRWLFGPATKSSMTSRFRFVKRFRKKSLGLFRSPRSRQALLPATRDSMTQAPPRVKGFSNFLQIIFLRPESLLSFAS